MIASGERIKQARELRGMTQTRLADEAGVTQAAIAQVEGGLFMASDDLLEAIAKATRQPVAFFLQEPAPEFPLGSLLFRSHAAMTKRVMTETARYAQTLYEAAIRLRQSLREIPVKIPILSGVKPEVAAREAREALQIPAREPAPHLLNALEWNGALVLTVPDAETRDAFSLWYRDVPIIAIAAGRPGDRLRLSVAHELGHLVIHRGKSRFEVDDTEADDFAAEFLMPEAAMLKEMVPPVTLSLLATLKPRWRVSIQAMIRRAKDIGTITDRQYRYLFQQLSAMGWRKQEPIELPIEKPRAFRQMAEMLYGTPIDYQRLAHDLRLSPEMIRAAMAEYAGKEDAPKPVVVSNVVSLPRRRGQ